MPPTDQELLRLYALDHSDPAFAELVERHKHWLYSVCLRRLHNPTLAEDAAQAVLIALARKASSLANHPSLTRWLYQAARFVAHDVRKAERRRSRREAEVAHMQTVSDTSPSTDPWLDIAPHLEPALDRLPEKYRLALLLRFYQQKSHPEIAATLGISEPAAQKRVSRGLERLRAQLIDANPSLSASALSSLLFAHCIHSAPATLTASAITAAAASTTTTAASILSQGILNMMRWTKIKITAVVAILTILCGGTLFHLLLSHQADAPAAIASAPTATLPAEAIPEKPSALIAPYLNEHTIMVAHLDATLVDTAALEKFTNDAIAATPAAEAASLPTPSQIAMLRLIADGYLARFKHLGGRHIYELSPLDIQLPPKYRITVGYFALLIPIEPGADVKGLMALLATLPKRAGFPVRLNDHLLALCTPQTLEILQAPTVNPRPDLQKALDTGNGAIQLAVSFSRADAATLFKLNPTLPPDYGSKSTDIFYDHLQYSILSLHLPPDAEFTLIAKSDSSDHAAALASAWNRLRALGFDGELRDALPKLLDATSDCSTARIHLTADELHTVTTQFFHMAASQIAEEETPAPTTTQATRPARP